MTKYELMVTKYGCDCEIPIQFLKDDKSLQKLDQFTTRFKDKTELMIHLFDMGAIKYDDIPLKPMVGYTHMGFFHKIDVLYSSDVKYLDTVVLKERIVRLGQRLVYGVQSGTISKEDKENDIKLVKKIISTYFTNPLYKKYIFFMRNFLSDLEKGVFNVENANNFQAALSFIFDNELTSFDKKEGISRDNYKGIRVMGHMFSKFDESIELERKPTKQAVEKCEQLMIPGFEDEYRKAIQRSRKKENIEQ